MTSWRRGELDEESRILFEATYEPEDSRTLRLLSSLALDHGLNSDYGKARKLYEDAFRRMSPTGTLSTASDVLGAWIGISWTLRLLGQFQLAFDVGQEALDYAVDPEGLGPEHVATLRAVTAYTIVCRRIPQMREEALELARTTYEVSTSRYGENHPETLAIGISLSNLLRTMSDDFHAGGAGPGRGDGEPLSARVRAEPPVQLRLHEQPRPAAAGHGESRRRAGDR